MARLMIKRANGDIEYAELTTDKSLVGGHYLTVERAGTPYYAKLGDSVSTHLCVEGNDGRKLYVQKEVKFVWGYTFDGTKENADKMVIPRTGKYRLYMSGTENSWDDQAEKPFSYTETAIFKKGTKVINGSYIQSETQSKYYLYRDYRDCGDEGCFGRVVSLDTIGYIGEA